MPDRELTAGVSAAASGEQFEQQVAAVYRALGYEVERNVLLDGQQVDILARRRLPGTGTISVAVECKYRTSTSIPNHEVADFATCYAPLIFSGAATKAVLVSNVPASARAKEVLRPQRNLAATTLDALRGLVLDPTEALISYVDRYEDSAIYSTFMEPSLRALNPSNADLSYTAKPALKAVRDLVHEARSKPYRLVLLADFGAGKTTLLERIKYEFAKDFLAAQLPPVPLFFRLQDFGRFPSLDEYVSWVTLREFGHTLSLDAFWNLVKRGNLLLLLDSFDEIAARVDQDLRTRLLLTLSPLLTGASLAIMTSRPSYFTSLNEYYNALRSLRSEHSAYELRPSGVNSVDLAETVMRRHITHPQSRQFAAPVFLTCRLEPLTEPEIDLFLSRYDAQFRETVNATAAQVAAGLRNIYDLGDLMRRPIILEMVVDTVLSGAIDIQKEQQIRPAHLYEAYTSAKLGIDWDRGPVRRGGLSVDDRRDFAEECAMEMMRSGMQLLSSEQVNVILDGVRTRSASSKLSREESLTDLRTCSFLTIDERGLLRFIHKSFGEFFLARRLVSSLRAHSSDRMMADPPEALLHSQSVEVLGFAADLLSDDKDLRVRLSESIPKASSSVQAAVVGRNRLILALMLHRHGGALSLRGQSLSDSTFSDLRVRGSTWRDVSVTRVTFRSLAFDNSRLESVSFQDSSLEGLVLDNTPTSIDLVDSSIDDAKFHNTRAYITSRNSQVRSASLQGSDTAVLDALEIGDAYVEDGALLVRGRHSIAQLVLQRCFVQIEDVDTSDAETDDEQEASVDATAHTASGCAIGSLTAKDSIILIRRLTRCSGVEIGRSIVVLLDAVSVDSLFADAAISDSLIVSCAGASGAVLDRVDIRGSFVFGVAVQDDSALDSAGVLVKRRRAGTSAMDQRDGAGLVFRPTSGGSGALVVDSSSELHESIVVSARQLAHSIAIGEMEVPLRVNRFIDTFVEDASISSRILRGMPGSLPSVAGMRGLRMMGCQPKDV